MEHHVTVAIVDDHPVVIEGVISWISADPERRITVTQVVSDITGLASPRVADVLILDLELGGRMVADEVAQLAASGYRIVAFSAHVDPALILDVLDAGAHAYVSKDEGREHLLEAVLAAAEDRPCVTRSQAKAILADPRPGRPALSGKERQALLLWFQGMSKASVARRMSISENTVRQYIDRARVKYATLGRDTRRTRCWPGPSRTALSCRARWPRTPPSPPSPLPRPPDRRRSGRDALRTAALPNAGRHPASSRWPLGRQRGRGARGRGSQELGHVETRSDHLLEHEVVVRSRMARVSAAITAFRLRLSALFCCCSPDRDQLVEPFTVYTPSTITIFRWEMALCTELVPIAMLLPKALLFHLARIAFSCAPDAWLRSRLI